MQIQAVAFDMDGLLFDTERLALDAWAWAGEQIGLPIQRGIVMLTLGLDRYDTRRVFEEHYGPRDDYDHIRDLRVQYTKMVIERDGMPIRPGLMPLLDVLDARGIRYALATSTDRERAYYYLDRAGLSERFRYRVCGDMVRAGKPEPDIYSMAAQIMEVEPQRCIALEDAPLGILAAHRAGCLPVMVPDLVQPDAETAAMLYAKVDRLDQVIPLLDGSKGCGSV